MRPDGSGRGSSSDRQTRQIVHRFRFSSSSAFFLFLALLRVFARKTLALVCESNWLRSAKCCERSAHEMPSFPVGRGWRDTEK
jgi:hypothetical protein